MFKFLRKEKENKGDLEKAKDLKLITEEEALELEIKRAEKKLKGLKEKKK